MSEKEFNIALALGSNVGDRLKAMRDAIENLGSYVTITAVSQIYETEPVYVTDQDLFLNAALIGTTRLSPKQLLTQLKQTEVTIGRTHTLRNGPRVIDLDILFYEDLIMTTDLLTIPHPMLDERDFVLLPLCDIAPLWEHPIKHQTAAQMLAHLPKSDVVIFARAL